MSGMGKKTKSFLLNIPECSLPSTQRQSSANERNGQENQSFLLNIPECSPPSTGRPEGLFMPLNANYCLIFLCLSAYLSYLCSTNDNLKRYAI